MKWMKRLCSAALTAVLTISLASTALAADYSFNTDAPQDYYEDTSYEDIYGSQYNYGGPNIVDFQAPELEYGLFSTTQTKGVLLYTAEELDSIQEEEGELPMIEDSVSSLTPNNNGVKEGEISNEPNVVVTQGEMPDERSTMPDENGIYACAEQQPEFPGGPAEMMRFIGRHLRYPEEQLKEGIQGRVVVQFYVDTLGHVCDPKIVRGKDSALDKEALRVVSLFPDFTPGRLNGKKVNVLMTLPIIFKLPAD